MVVHYTLGWSERDWNRWRLAPEESSLEILQLVLGEDLGKLFIASDVIEFQAAIDEFSELVFIGQVFFIGWVVTADQAAGIHDLRLLQNDTVVILAIF